MARMQPLTVLAVQGGDTQTKTHVAQLGVNMCAGNWGSCIAGCRLGAMLAKC